MRVLHLDSGREMRGGQWQVLRLHRGLLAAGVDSLLLARAGSPLAGIAREEGLPVGVPGSVWRGFDLVQAHDAHSHTRAALFARAPLVVSRRVAFPVKRTFASRWKYGRPRLFLAVSNFVARQLRVAGVPDDRIAVVYDGVPIPSRPANGDATVVFQKGVALSGVPGESCQDLMADLPRTRVLVYLSESEGLGSGILLAMSYGVTVIASNVGGIPELIEDGVTGILVQNEANSVIGALQRADPALGQAARLRVMARFTEERMVRETLAAYEKVLGQ